MEGKEDVRKAVILNADDVARLVDVIRHYSEYPVQDRLAVQLSLRGLRAIESCKTEVRHVTDAVGRIGQWIWIPREAAKNGMERYVPINRRLRIGIEAHLRVSGIEQGPLLRTCDGRPIESTALRARFERFFQLAGLYGASSYSGRRTAATLMARYAGVAQCPLEEIMLITGHKDVNNLMEYIDRCSDHGSLVCHV